MESASKNALEDKMSWSELCDNRAELFKKKNFFEDEKDEQRFREWFMQREKVGLKFDYQLLARTYTIYKELENKLVHFVIVTGREGTGKTTIMSNVLAWLNPNFSKEDYCTQVKQYLGKLRQKIKKYKEQGIIEPSSIALDEGTEAMSMDSNTQVTSLIKTFFIQRKLRVAVGVCQPNFYALNSYIREHHAIYGTLIHVTRKTETFCEYRCFTKRAIEILNENKKHKNVMAWKVPYGSFFDGRCRLLFPQTIKFEDYEHDAINKIDETLEKLENKIAEKEALKKGVLSGVAHAEKETPVVTCKEMSEVLGYTSDTVKKYMQRGDWPGIRIGNRWFMKRSDFNKMVGLDVPKKDDS